MPLPENGAAWPPKNAKPALELMEVHDAWWSSDPFALASVYQSNKWLNHRAQYAGGVVGFAARLWWGKPQPQGEHRVKLHLPVAADISTMSADLLFSEPPRFVIPDASRTAADGTIVKAPEQEKIEDVVNVPEVYTAFLEAAEVASALGGGYLRLIWDKARMDHVGIEAVHADNAIPTYRNGQLSEVVFWSVVSDEGDADVLRHMEFVEPGRITHALYSGDRDSVGRRIPLASHPATEWVAQMSAADAGIPGVTSGDGGYTISLETGVEGIPVMYVPNMRPNRSFRKNAYLSQFGRSDYAGIEPAFDAIDEAWSSWARDVRLAKARIIVPNAYLDDAGPGRGVSWDTEREVYEGLDFLSNDRDRTITPQQFAIRVDEHRATITEWTRYALRGAGFSPSSLGEREASTLRTATEVTAEERLTHRTRDKKTMYWKAALRPFVRTWMDLEAAIFGGPQLTEYTEVRFPIESQQDPEELARIAQLQATSQSASIQTRVRGLHPEWDGETVNAEVERIRFETGVMQAPLPDAAAYRGILDDAASNPMGDEEAAQVEQKLRDRVQEVLQQTPGAQGGR